MGHTELHKETIGTKTVRLDFNVNSNEDVYHIKALTAQIIDFCESMKEKDPRLAALAKTAYEEAAMWAVKLATA